MAVVISKRRATTRRSSDSRFYTPAFHVRELRPDFADQALAASGAKIRALLNGPNLTKYERGRLEHLERLHSMEYFGF
jgi:hypothetical protein